MNNSISNCNTVTNTSYYNNAGTNYNYNYNYNCNYKNKRINIDMNMNSSASKINNSYMYKSNNSINNGTV